MNNLKKITNLIKKTGDKLIVVDEQMDPQFVIMDVADYEKMLSVSTNVVDLTEDELLSKINRDIAVWKSDQDLEQSFEVIDENWQDEENDELKDFKEEDYLEDDDDDIYLDEINDDEIVKREIEKIDDLKRRSVEIQEIQKETKNKDDDEMYYFEPVDDEIDL